MLEPAEHTFPTPRTFEPQPATWAKAFTRRRLVVGAIGGAVLLSGAVAVRLLYTYRVVCVERS